MQLLKMYFYLGEISDGLGILNRIVYEGSNTGYGSENIRSPGNIHTKTDKYALVSKDAFKRSRAFEILDEIKYELDRLNSYSGSEINLILIDEDSSGSSNGCGIVQQLSCSIGKPEKSKSGIVLDNITDLNETDIRESLVNVRNTARRLLHKSGLKKNTDYYPVKLFYESRKSIYKGKSFLLPASILVFCNFHNSNSIFYSYKVSSSIAFTGALDDNGNLSRLPNNIMKAKVYTAFFSWIKCIVIPYDNIPDAEEEIARLNLKYPGRKLNVTGLKNVSEIFNYPEILKKDKHTLKEAGREQFSKHILKTTIAAAILLIIITLGFVKLFIKDIVKPLPAPDSEMYAIYTPGSDNLWTFHNSDYFGGDTIHFGDAAIGDLWYPYFDLINNGFKNEKFKIDLEGRDKNEFEIIWREESFQPQAPVLKPDIRQRIYVKFRPLNYSSTGLKEAVLSVYPESSPDLKKKIYLRGNSVIYDKGYSLMFNDGDDQLVVNNDKNILNDEFTISFWVNPLRTDTLTSDISLMMNDDGTRNKFYILISKDSSVNFNLMLNKAKPEPQFFASKNKIRFGQWNYIAVSYNKGNASIILNEEITKIKFEDNPVKMIGDKLVFGGTKTPDKRKIEKPGKINFKFLINNIKMWSREMPPSYLIREKLSNGQDTSKSLILQYDFDDMNFETVFDMSKNDFWGTTYGGMTRKMDSPDYVKNKTSNAGNGENKVLSLGKRGVMICPEDLFGKPSSFTLQVDAKADIKDSAASNSFFNISHPDIEAEFLYINRKIRLIFDNKIIPSLRSKDIPFSLENKWHRYTMCYSYENDFLVLYMDSTEVMRFDSLKFKYDISKWYYCLTFGSSKFFYAPRVLHNDVKIDNAKIFNRVILPSEIYNLTSEGLLAYWTFERTENCIAFDEVRRIPAMLWQKYDIIDEDF